MLQRAAIPVFIVFFAGLAFAQHGAGFHHPDPHRGAPAPPPASRDMFGFDRLNQIMNTFPMQLGRNIAGLPPLTSPRGGGRQTYPALVGTIPGLWPYGYQPPPPPQPVFPLYTAPPPVAVVINNNYSPQVFSAPVATGTPVSSEVKSFTAPPSASELRRSAQSAKKSSESAPIYLIAFKDGSLVTAYAYWIEDGNLHCVTTSNARKQAPLGDVDLALTERLNRERGVEFQLNKE